MKRLLAAVSALAIINLLGIIGAAGWLAATQRLSPERVEAIKAILHEPVPVEAARLEEEARAAEAEAGEAKPEDLPLPPAPPLSADQLVGLRSEFEAGEEFRLQRQSREAATLGRTIDEEVRRLERQRQEFFAQRDAFRQELQQIEQLKGDEQFQAALSVLAQVKPDKATAMLQEIIEGRAGVTEAASGLSGIDRAVAYLDELDEMIRGKIMSEFVDDSPTLAADLLERLRTFGLMADASGGTGP